MSYFKSVIENNAIVLGDGKLEVSFQDGENEYCILEASNKQRLETFKKFHSEFSYKPNTILLGITAPKCNLDCEFCLRKYNEHFNTPETEITELEYVLHRSVEANVNVSLVFFNNEAFNAANSEWQESISRAIDANRDTIKSIMFFTNGIDLVDGKHHHLLEYASKVYDPDGKRVKVCMAVNIAGSGSDTHITINGDYKSRIDYVKKYVNNHFELNLLYDIRDTIDYDALEEFLAYVKISGISLKVSVIIRETSDAPTVDLDRLSSVFSKYDTGNYGKLTGLYSQFSDTVPISMDGPPNYAIVNNNSIRGITSGKEYKIDSAQDLFNAMDRYIFEAFPAFDKCQQCSGNCEDIVASGKCEARLINRCLTCPIFGDCSGFFCQGNMKFRPCDLEVFDIQFNLATKLKTIIHNSVTYKEIQEGLDEKLLNPCYTGLINKSFRRKQND